jgi:hypothetical protein
MVVDGVSVTVAALALWLLLLSGDARIAGRAESWAVAWLSVIKRSNVGQPPNEE